MKYFDTSSADFEKSFQSLILSTLEPNKNVLETVSKIISDVRKRGDDALLEYTNHYDHLSAKLETLEIKKDEVEAALDRISDSMREYTSIIAVNSAILFVCLPIITPETFRGSFSPK